MTRAGFPNFRDKHEFDGLISPQEVVAYVRDNPRLVVPDAAIMTYGATMHRMLEGRGATLIEGYPGPWYRLHLIQREGTKVGVLSDFGIGAPAAAMVLEELAAMGVRQVLSIGMAGGLQPDAAFGDVVVCTAAIRDEGVSHHYLPAAKFSHPSEALTRRFSKALSNQGESHTKGPSWTIDAPYRETLEEARSYQADGVLTVEMEAAALFTVAEYRGVEMASGFVISDTLLVEEQWSYNFGGHVVQEGSRKLLDAAIKTFESAQT